MGKKGAYMPISDKDAEELVERFAEHGATEEDIADPGRWHDYITRTFRDMTGRELTGSQVGAFERGRQLYGRAYQEIQAMPVYAREPVRRGKYLTIRSYGYEAAHARVMRDWSWRRILALPRLF